MKIIGRDNYNRDTVDEILICSNVNAVYGNRIISFLQGTDIEDYFYVLVDDNYKLYKWEP